MPERAPVITAGEGAPPARNSACLRNVNRQRVIRPCRAGMQASPGIPSAEERFDYRSDRPHNRLTVGPEQFVPRVERA